MKLTLKKIKQLIKEELKNIDQDCLDFVPSIKKLWFSGEKELIIQGFELFHVLSGLDVNLNVHGGKPAREGLPDPRVHIEVSGSDLEKFIKCINFHELVSPGRYKKSLSDGLFKLSLIPTGMRYNMWKRSFGSENK